MYKGKSLYFNAWLCNGIKHIYQVFDRGRLKMRRQIELIVGNYAGLLFEYLALINAIPLTWKTHLEANADTSMNGQAEAVTDPEDYYKEDLFLLNQENGMLRKKLSLEITTHVGKDSGKIKQVLISRINTK